MSPRRRPERLRRTTPTTRKSKPKSPVTVFVAGCFNRVHPAHLRLLRQARALGDRLVVVLSNDAHNKKPHAVPAAARKKALESFGAADEVVVGGADGFAPTLRRLHPDVLVLGYDQRLPDEETARAVRELGVEVVVMPWFPGKEDPGASHCS